MHLMLQQDEPDDYVIATGEQHSVREMCEQAFAEIGVTLAWRGSGPDEVGVVDAVDAEQLSAARLGYPFAEAERRAGHRPAAGADQGTAAERLAAPATQARVALEPGVAVVRVDPRYYRPTEVGTLLGDATKARERLGWTPTIGFRDLVAEMVRDDLAEACRDDLILRGGFDVREHRE
jgi:GDPmannose 4,6-dehydratase